MPVAIEKRRTSANFGASPHTSSQRRTSANFGASPHASHRSSVEQRPADAAGSSPSGAQSLQGKSFSGDQSAQRVSVAHLTAVAELLFFAGANDVARFERARCKVRLPAHCPKLTYVCM
jgi:hypothetical protein